MEKLVAVEASRLANKAPSHNILSIFAEILYNIVLFEGGAGFFVTLHKIKTSAKLGAVSAELLKYKLFLFLFSYLLFFIFCDANLPFWQSYFLVNLARWARNDFMTVQSKIMSK